MLVPLSWLFAAITAFRRRAYQLGLLKSYVLPVPVIVVGNINIGGSGKTPVVIWLVEQLKQHGFKPAVISRGYGGSVSSATSVDANGQASIVGDEPVLIANRGQCPVWVGANRVQVANELLKAHPECNVIISDDGLQHYRLKRDIEIAVVDSNYSEKNARLLPAGPLREPVSRLNTVDAIVLNGEASNIKLRAGEKTNNTAYQMQLVGEKFYNLADANITASSADFKHKKVTALAGIGKPERFFEHLRNLGLAFASVSFADHYAFTAQDLAQIDCDAIIMTEKDAVKCRAFARQNCWVLPVEASIDAALMPLILNKIAKS
ncbi:MAG: tetraacyldisaccharide 4'-kinase [Methylotenera sp.]